MRVALFVHCYYPEHFYGTESYTRTLARELSALGHEPVVVTATFPGEPPQQDLIERYMFDGVPVVRIDRNVHPNTGLRDTYDLPSLRAVHERVLRAIQPDIVHVCHLINHTTALLEVTRRLGLPTVATFTDFFGFCFNNKLSAADGSLCAGPNPSRSNCVACSLFADGTAARNPARHLLARLVSSGATHLPILVPGWRRTISALKDRPEHLAAAYGTYAGALTPTRFLMEAYKRTSIGVPLELSRFGIDIDRAPKPAPTGGPTRLGFIGQLAPHKGLHLLLKAMRAVPQGAFTLDVHGDEDMDPAYAAQVRGLAEGLDVAFRGTFSVERIADVLGQIDLLVIPSTWVENSPLILLQALATHTPVLVADVEGMSEFVEVGRNGFTFAKGSVADLAARLKPFAQDPGLARAMSMMTHYERTSRHMVADVADFYARACGIL
ncbi:glycosyltransferase family 4 protein [Xanthobacter autotrophicus]|uniref:glycosyltransferase family 4 protein n=1 Tax=Xanthobacter autotrophicus TaxID=280 RepID=UPI00372C4295